MPTHIPPLKRRDVLKFALCGAAMGVTSFILPTSLFAATPSMLAPGKVLVIIKLNGGNDGLNTLVPVTGWTSAATAPKSEYAYYKGFRPNIGLNATDLVSRDDHYGFHPSLAPLMSAWNGGAGDMAVALGVGYPGPGSTPLDVQPMVDSHFKGSDLWDYAYVADDSMPSLGWIANLLSQMVPAGRPVAQAAMLGNIPIGPLAGNSQTVAVTPNMVLNNNPEATEARRNNPVYTAVYNTQAELDTASAPISSYADIQYPAGLSTLGQQLYYVSQMISGYTMTSGQRVAPLGIPVYVINQSTYDTHLAQGNKIGTQANLLADFASSVATFRSALIASGNWNKVLTMTYSEFGRTITENSAQGTDHGQSNTHFIFGGAVKGGYIGTQNSLSTVGSNGLLSYTQDFRSLYATAIHWLGGTSQVSYNVLSGNNFTPLNIY